MAKAEKSDKVIFKTERLILRPWETSDVEYLYEYAKDPDVGTAAGWAPHKSIEESREILRDILMAPESYAVVLKSRGYPIGSISFLIGEKSNIDISDEDAEIGYWIAKPFWGRGIMPEAIEEMLRHGFEDLHFSRIWAEHFEENQRSYRVLFRCGFRYHSTKRNMYVVRLDEYRTIDVRSLSLKRWKRKHGKSDRRLG